MLRGALALAFVLAAGLGALNAAPGRGVATRPAKQLGLVDAEAAAADEGRRSSCRVVATPLVSQAGGWVMTAELKNGGTEAVSLGFLQAGWKNDARLERVDVGAVAVFNGSLASPAVAWLAAKNGDTLALAAGETLALRLTFAAGAGGAPPALSQAVAFLGEGCAVTLAAPPASECPLENTGVDTAPITPTLATVHLVNRGKQAAQVATLDISWPEDTSGRLVALWLNGQPLYTLGRNAAHSPTTLDLRPLADQRLVVPPGGILLLGLVFDKIAVPQEIRVTAADETGCQAANQSLLASYGCGIDLGSFATGDRLARLQITNRRGVPAVITHFDLFWPVQTNGPLTGLFVGGVPVWQGELAQSPAVIDLDLARAVSMAPDQKGELWLQFGAQPLVPGGAQPSPRPAIAASGYTVVVGARSGCNAVWSSLASQPQGCKAEATPLQLDGPARTVTTTLRAGAAPAALTRLVLTWPERNGPLVGVYWNDQPLFAGRQPYASDPFVLPLAGGVAALPADSSRDLRLVFEQRAVRGGYAISMQFTGAAGQACSDLLLTTPPTLLECKASFGALQALSANEMDLDLTNSGADELQLRHMDISWPAENAGAVLKAVLLVNGSQEQVVWSGAASQRPARLVPNGALAPLLPAGLTLKLRLRFEGLNLAPSQRNQLRVTVGFVEGCQASFTPSGQLLPPERVKFSGVLKSLPEAAKGGLIGCCWRIATDDGEKLVEVNGSTRLEPDGHTPAAGDIVTVVALSEDGRLVAEQIYFRNEPAEVSLLGPIDDLDPAPRPAWLVVLGRNVKRDAETAVDGELAVGQLVMVRGVAVDEKTILARLIEVQSTPKNDLVLVSGVVQWAKLLGASAPADPTCPGLQLWAVGEYQVCITPSTLLSGLAAGAAPTPGQQVELQGSLSGQVLTASQVEVKPLPEIQTWSGVVKALPPSGLVGNWTVTLADGDHQLSVEVPGVVDTSRAPARANMRFKAAVRINGGGPPVALSLRLDWPE